MTTPEHFRLIGTYACPRLTIGANTFCLYRRHTVFITSSTDAPIPWPPWGG